MSEETTDTSIVDETIAVLRARAESLERQLGAVQRDTEERLIRAELKTEATRAGIVDIEGLKLLDASGLAVNEQGEVEGASAAIAALKRAKPWLFTASTSGFSSSTAAVPMPAKPRIKHASDMTEAEWRTARAELLRRRP